MKSTQFLLCSDCAKVNVKKVGQCEFSGRTLRLNTKHKLLNDCISDSGFHLFSFLKTGKIIASRIFG